MALRYPSRIYLIGMPASGKTSMGKRLAAALDYPFLDLDWELERRAGVPIPALFAERGEAYFRELEREVLRGTLPDPAVLATGGGAPCFFDNLAFMQAHGATVFLDVPVQVLAERAWKRRGSRPMLAQATFEEVREQVRGLHAQRLPFYEQAQVRFATLDHEAPLPELLARLLPLA